MTHTFPQEPSHDSGAVDQPDRLPSYLEFAPASRRTQARALLQKWFWPIALVEWFVYVALVGKVDLNVYVEALGFSLLFFLSHRYVFNTRSLHGFRDPILELEGVGDFEEGIASYRKLAVACDDPINRSMVVTNIAYLHRRSGDASVALRLFLELKRLGLKQRDDLLNSNLAITYTVLGDLNGAEHSLPAAPIVSGATHAVYWARTGDLDRVRRFVPPKARLGTAKMRRHEVRLVALMRAFAAGSNQTREQHLAKARASFQGEYDYLLPNWPSLKEFVQEYRSALEPKSLPLPTARVVP